MSSFYQMETPLTLHADPVNPMHAVSKRYVDDKVSAVAGSRFVSGVIGVSQLPALVGDVTTMPGSNVLSLNNSGVTAGVYNSVAVDSKGRVTSGSYLVPDTSSLSWNVVQNKPTTLGGFGITDVVSTVDGDSVASISMTDVQSSVGGAMVTKDTVDALMTQVDLSMVSSGEVVRQPSSLTPAGYLRANGGVVNKATYAALYAIVGSQITEGLGVTYAGRPWVHQEQLVRSSYPSSLTFSNVGSVPFGSYDHSVVVTKNKIFVFGTYINGGTPQNWSTNINEDGSFGTFTTYSNAIPEQTNMNNNRISYFVTKNYVYGVYAINGRVYSARITSTGDLEPWTLVQTIQNFTSKSIVRVLVYKEHVFILFQDSNDVQYSLYRSKLNLDDTLAVITKVGDFALPALTGIHAVMYNAANFTKTADIKDIFYSGNYIYIVASYNFYNEYYGSTFYSHIHQAYISTDGTLGSFSHNRSVIDQVLPWDGTTWYGQNWVYSTNALVTRERIYLLGATSHARVSRNPDIISIPVSSNGAITGSFALTGNTGWCLTDTELFAVKGRLCILGGYAWNSGGDKPAAVFSASLDGGSNDYITNMADWTVTNTDYFRLPDYTSKESAGLYYYIKY